METAHTAEAETQPEDIFGKLQAEAETAINKPHLARVLEEIIRLHGSDACHLEMRISMGHDRRDTPLAIDYTAYG